MFTATVGRAHNRVTPKVIRRVDGEAVTTTYPTTTNAVTDKAMQKMYNNDRLTIIDNGGSDVFYKLYVGTGTTEPSRSSTTMGGRIEVSSYKKEGLLDQVTTKEIGGVWHWSFPIRYSFEPGEIVGNITNYGAFNSGELFSGGLFRDSNGDPVAITVTADEQLIVDYEFLYPTLTGTDEYPTGSGMIMDVIAAPSSTPTIMNINGTDHTVSSETEAGYFHLNSNGFIRYQVRSIGANSPNRVEIYDSSDTKYMDGGAVVLTGNTTLNEQSIEYVRDLKIYPTAAIGDVKYIAFRGYYRSRGRFIVNIDPPIPIPSGEVFDINVAWKIDWSGQ